jgi:hypothetical protein
MPLADNPSDMEWVIAFAAFLATWSFLALLGNERQRRQRQLEYLISHETVRQESRKP